MLSEVCFCFRTAATGGAADNESFADGERSDGNGTLVAPLEFCAMSSSDISMCFPPLVFHGAKQLLGSTIVDALAQVAPDLEFVQLVGTDPSLGLVAKSLDYLLLKYATVVCRVAQVPLQTHWYSSPEPLAVFCCRDIALAEMAFSAAPECCAPIGHYS